MMKTEKRKATVGERILITGAEWGQRHYKNGNIATVRDKKAWVSSLLYVNEWEHSVHEFEYEVIVAEQKPPKKSARITALETQVAALEAKVEALESAGKAPKEHDTLATLYPLTERFERESSEVDAILADIERKAKPTLESILATYPTANEQRADVIKRAKAFVEEHTRHNVTNGLGTTTGVRFGIGKGLVVIPELHVNKEKRVVTCLLKRVDNVVHRKAFAKCDPDDVFNADIGKAIALARALGVNCPVEFVKAVQPTEVVVGMVVGSNTDSFDGFTVDTVSSKNGNIELYDYDGTWAHDFSVRITDDTDAVYE